MSIELPGSLLLVGAGKMGGAMLAGWLADGLDSTNVFVQDPAPPSEMKALIAEHGIACAGSCADVKAPPAIVVLAVKPQVMDDVLPTITDRVTEHTLVISIAAGKSISSLRRHLPAAGPLIRAMPNTPAAVGRGITGAFASAEVSASQRSVADQLLQSVGAVVWVESEDLIDAVTGVSGSGPAYVFHLVEAMAAAGESLGLTPDVAMQLARTTVTGAGELLHQSSDSAATLRQNVTSPGGTTAAALEVLMAEDGLGSLMASAISAAKNRAGELAD